MVIILRGISGAGKSTVSDLLRCDNHAFPAVDVFPIPRLIWQWARTIWEATRDMRATVFSADKRFTGPDGVYRFDPKYLSSAHAWCLREFSTAIVGGEDDRIDRGAPRNDELYIVDNTNTTIAEVAPYAALAVAYGHELHIGTLLADPALAYARNVHEVPITNVVKQHLQLQKSILEWPAWWPQAVMPV